MNLGPFIYVFPMSESFFPVKGAMNVVTTCVTILYVCIHPCITKMQIAHQSQIQEKETIEGIHQSNTSPLNSQTFFLITIDHMA